MTSPAETTGENREVREAPREPLSRKTAAWTARWALVVRSPRSYLREQGGLGLGAREFFFGCQLLVYLLALLASLLFFVAFFRHDLQAAARDNLIDSLWGVTALVSAYILINLLSLWAAAAVSYAGYRLAGSKASFESHFGCFADMAAFEPLLALLLAFSVLSEDLSWTLRLTLTVAAFVATRIWSLFVGAIWMPEVHGLRGRSRCLPWVGAYAPAVLLFSGGFGAVAWFLVGLGLFPGGWD